MIQKNNNCCTNIFIEIIYIKTTFRIVQNLIKTVKIAVLIIPYINIILIGAYIRRQTTVGLSIRRQFVTFQVRQYFVSQKKNLHLRQAVVPLHRIITNAFVITIIFHFFQINYGNILRKNWTF